MASTERGPGGERHAVSTRPTPQIRLLDDVTTDASIQALGWDPLLSMPDERTLAKAFQRQRRAVKAILLDQV